MGEILITVILAAALPAVFLPLNFRYRSRDRRKIIRDAVVNVKHGILIVGLCLAILFYVAGIALGIVLTLLAPSYATYIVVSILGALSALLAFACINDKFQYIVIEEKGVNSVCIYRKDKFIPYEKIKHYRLVALFGLPGIILYSHIGVTLLSSGFGCDENLYKLTQKLNDHGVYPVPLGVMFPTREMRRSAEFKQATKSGTTKIAIAAFTVCGACFMIMFGLTFGLNFPPQKFINYEVSGIVESYKFTSERYGSTNFNFTLEDDDHVYWVYSVVYDEVDVALQHDLYRGDAVNLLIAYDRDDNKRIVSQIELNGRIYLYAADAEAAEIADYEFGIKMSYVFLGLGCATFLGEIIYIIYICATKHKTEEKK